MPRLHVFPTEAALEVGLEEFLRARGERASGIEVGRSLTSVPRLLREALGGAARGIGSTAEDVLVRALCADGWGEGAVPSAYVARLKAALAALRRAHVVPSMLRAIAPALPPAARHDALRFAAALARYEELLGARVDEAAMAREALRVLARQPLPCLADVTEVELHDAAPIDPLTRAVVEAFAVRGLTVRCRIPEPPFARTRGGNARYEEALQAAVTAALEGLEAIGHDHVERHSGSLSPGPVPDVLVLPTPELESHAIARRVRDEIATGAAPDEIAVVAASGEQRRSISAALARHEVPSEATSGDPLSESGLAGAVRAVLGLADQRVTRDALAAVLSSRYLAPPRAADGSALPRGRIGPLLRAALPKSARVADWRGGLTQWIGNLPPARQREAEAVARHVLRARALVAAWPERGSLAEHAAALRAMFDGLGVGAIPIALPSLASVDRARAAARDAACAAAIDDWLAEIPRAAARVGLAERRWSRRDVAEMLFDRLAGTRAPAPAGRGAAVSVGSLDRLPVRPLRLLVLAGMDERALSRPGDDPLVHDETRRTLGRALGRMVFVGPGHEEARDRIRLAQVRSRAARVLVTVSRADAMGRALVPGEVVLHARAIGATEARPLSGLVPSASDGRTLLELAARLLLEEGGDVSSREGWSAASRQRVRERIASHAPPLLYHASRRAEIERQRARFFAGEAEAGRYDGRVGDEAVLSQLVATAMPGSAVRPLSASTLTQHAQCPQRFFLDSVLRARPGEELEDELDERAGGTLAHLALEKLFSAWRDAGLLPLRGLPEEEGMIDPALERAIAQFSAEQPIGNPVLFAVRRRTLGRLLRAVWRLEVVDPPQPGLVPFAFEMRFDALAVPGGAAGAQPVFVRGSIDRVDRSSDGRRAAVFDYKSGRSSSLTAELKEEALAETSWQLPLYAAVVRQALGAAAVEMVYYPLRDLKPKAASAPDWARFEADLGAEPAGLLSHRIWSRVESMRGGHFEVAPRAKACERCRMQPVCRIVERSGDEQVNDEEGSA